MYVCTYIYIYVYIYIHIHDRFLDAVRTILMSLMALGKLKYSGKIISTIQPECADQKGRFRELPPLVLIGKLAHCFSTAAGKLVFSLGIHTHTCMYNTYIFII